jgi:hypothetical protein
LAGSALGLVIPTSFSPCPLATNIAAISRGSLAMSLAFKDIRKNIGRFIMTTIGIGMLLMIVMPMRLESTCFLNFRAVYSPTKT